MNTQTHTTTARALVAASVALFAPLAHAQPEYDFIHFDYPGAGEVVLSDINDQGVACGRIGMSTGLELAFAWSQATGITIVPVYKPEGLNNSRLVVGLGNVYSVETGQSWLPPNLPGTYGSPTFGDADDTGLVVGAISTRSGSDSNGTGYIPYLWDAVNGARTMAIPNARGLWKINNTGTAIGWLYNSSTNDGFFADVNTGAYTVLASIFPSNIGIGPVSASGINDLGNIVGSRASSAFPIQRYGYIYSPDTGFQMLPFPGAGYLQTVTPTSINNAGTVVGTLQTSTATQHVFVYSAAHGLRDLWDNHAVIAGMPAGYRLHYAAKINNQGCIAGWGFTASFHQTSFVLKPILACPNITTHPQNQAACLNQAVSLTIAADGPAPLSFQWLRNDLPINITINPTAATNTLMITSAQADDRATYRCTVSNACGNVTSNPATITICLGDFNCDTGVDGDDVIAFFSAWDSNSPTADINNDGGTDGDDVIAFFGAWDAGC